MKLHIFILCLLIQLMSCQKNTKNFDHLTVNKEQSPAKINFIDYPIDDFEGIVSTQFDGIYRNFDFKYRNGETTFILVPKIGSEKWYSEQKNKIHNQDIDATIEKGLNQQSLKILSKEFDFWVFHTSKEFLKSTPNMDAPYTPLTPRKIFLYQYNTSSNTWKIADTFSVDNDNDEAKANQWRESKILKLKTKQETTTSSSSLDSWTGIYLNSDNLQLTSYQEIKNRIGWYELKISSKEITFDNDSRMESEFPTESPGGYSIHYTCNYSISGNTIKLYAKDENDTSSPKNISDSEKKPVLILNKKDNKYYAISSDIKDSESLVNSARAKSPSPYLFYRFDINIH